MFKAIPKNLRQAVNLGLALLFTVVSNLSFISLINPATAHADGSNISSIGSIGGYDSLPLNNPSGVALDSSGNVYIANDGNNCIQKFDPSGSYLTQWGANNCNGNNGTGDGEFTSPYGIAVDSSDNVFVADTNNHRIQKFDSSGTYQSQFGAQGSGDGEFSYPQSVITDPSDNIYVADSGNNRIQKFDNSGDHLLNIQANGMPILSYGIAVDGSNNVYTNQIPEEGFPYPGHLLKFSVDGELTDTWQYDSGSGFPMTVVASTNALYALVVDQEFSNPAIVKTDFSGNVITQWDVDSPSLGLALDSNENIYYLNLATGQIEKYSSTGTPLAQYAEPGTGDGQINTNVEEGAILTRLAIDSSGNMYVSDFSEAGGRIQKLNSSGQFISKLELDNYVYGIGISPQGNLYMGGGNGGNVIQKRSTSTFELLDEYDASDLNTPFEMFSNPVITETGLIYAANTEAYQINILCDASISTDGCQTADENAGGDTDSDTIPDSTESAGPNDGDANNDGTPDSEQANVASMIDPVTGDYAVLEV